MPVESSAAPTIITNDFIGFSANSNGGTLPLARIPGQDNNGTFGSTGTLSAGGLWPAFGQLTNDTGGGRRSRWLRRHRGASALHADRAWGRDVVRLIRSRPT